MTNIRKSNKMIVFAIEMMIIFSLVFTGQTIIQGTVKATGTTYYVSQSGGNDNNNGTSPSTPWKTLGKVSSITFSGGDSVLLKCGDTWTGEILYPHATNASSTNWVTLSSYGTGNKPKILPGASYDWCILIANNNYADMNCGWKITNLEVGNAKMGIGQMDYRGDRIAALDGLWIENCYIHNIEGITPLQDYNLPFSTGIRTSANSCIFNVTYKNNTFDYCDSAVYTWFVYNLTVSNNTVTNSGYFGIEEYVTFNTTFQDNTILDTGLKQTGIGTTAIELDGGDNVLVDNCEMAYTRSDLYDGCGLDFEGGTHSATVQNCNIHDNDGRAFLIMPATQDPNVNTHLLNNTISNCGTKTTSAEASFIMINGDYNNGGTITGNTITKTYTGQSLNLIDNSFTNSYPYGLSASNNTVNEASADSWEFNSYGNTGGWSTVSNISNFTSIYGNLYGTITGTSPQIISGDNMGYAITSNKILKIRFMNNTGSTSAKVYFTTNSDTTFNEAKSKTFTINAYDKHVVEYQIDMSSVSGWTGTLKQMKLNLGNSIGAFKMDYIRIASSTTPTATPTLTPTPTPANGAKLTGTAFGTTPAYSQGSEYDKASDGNTSSCFDYYTGNGGYTGIDLGSGNAARITRIRFYPRASWEGRMLGGKFQGSNTSQSSGYTDLYTITSTPPLAWTEVSISDTNSYRYLRYLGPDGSYCNIAEMEFYSDNIPTATATATPTPTATSSSYAWEFNTDGNTEGWNQTNMISNLNVSNGCLGGTITGNDPYVFSTDNLGYDITNNKILRIKMKNSSNGTYGEIYFITNTDGNFDENKKTTFTLVQNDPNYTEYVIDMSSVPSWTGTLRRFRIDPENGTSSGSFSIDYVRIGGSTITASPTATPTATPAATPTPTPTSTSGYAYSAEFNTDGNMENWWMANDISNAAVSGGYLNGTITGGDPSMYSPDYIGVSATNKTVTIRMKNSTNSTLAQFYFITNTDQTFDGNKEKDFTVVANDSGYTVYTIDMSTIPTWTGTIRRIRIDPNNGASSGTFSIDYVRIGS